MLWWEYCQVNSGTLYKKRNTLCCNHYVRVFAFWEIWGWRLSVFCQSYCLSVHLSICLSLYHARIWVLVLRTVSAASEHLVVRLDFRQMKQVIWFCTVTMLQYVSCCSSPTQQMFSKKLNSLTAILLKAFEWGILKINHFENTVLCLKRMLGKTHNEYKYIYIIVQLGTR